MQSRRGWCDQEINLYLQCSFAMVIIMSTTIQQSLRPLFLIYFIMGLGVYPTKQLKSKFRWIAHLSILYSLTIWFIYGYVLFFTFTIFSPKLLFWSITGIVIMATVNFNAITSAILIFYHYKVRSTLYFLYL